MVEMDGVGAWLERLGLGEYREVFAENDIDFDVLPELTDQDLKDLGLSLGHRKRLLKAIAALGPEEPPASSASAAARDGERRQITVMFCDIVGSTALSETLDPEDLREVMRTYQSTASAIIARYDGHVAQYLGDGLMVYFGYPLAHEDDAARAVRAGLEIVEAVQALSLPITLAVRVGISTGVVVVGETGAGDAAVPSAAVGETPNLAARVQALAEPNAVMVTEYTHRLLGGAFAQGDFGEHRLKGISEPIQVYRVWGEIAAESRFEAWHLSGVTPLVGRRDEVGVLTARWAHAREGRGRVVLLSGEPGIGKSRLIQTLREHLAGEPHLRLRYQCSPYHGTSALYPVITQLEGAAQFLRGDSPDQRLAKLEAVVARATDAPEEIVPFFAAMLSIDAGHRYPLPDLSPQRRRERMLDAVSAYVGGLAVREPLLVVFEDAQWIDPTTAEALTRLVERVRESRILMVVTFRPEFTPPWPSAPHISALAIERLTRREGAAMVEKVAGGKPLPEALIDHIVAKTDGVPLFLEELTKTVIDSGILVDQGDHYTLTEPLVPLSIPATLQDLLIARLDRLAPVKEIAQIGAVIGREFSYELISAVSPLEGDELLEALGQLVNAEVIFRRGQLPNASYVFRQALLRDAAYESLLRSRRQELHRQIAEAMEERSLQKGESQPELLAQHYASAGLPDKATLHWLEAGRRAARLGTYVEAVAHLTKGLEQVKRLPPGEAQDRLELDLQAALAAALVAGRGPSVQGARTAFDRAHILCRRLRDRPRMFDVLAGLVGYHFARGDMGSALATAREIERLAQNADDPVQILKAQATVAQPLVMRGEFAAAMDYINAVLGSDPRRHEEPVQNFNQDYRARCLVFAANALWPLGQPDRSRAAQADGEAQARALGHSYTLTSGVSGKSSPKAPHSPRAPAHRSKSAPRRLSAAGSRRSRARLRRALRRCGRVSASCARAARSS